MELEIHTDHVGDLSTRVFPIYAKLGCGWVPRFCHSDKRGGQRRYLRECRPRTHASTVIDHSDLPHPLAAYRRGSTVP